MTDRELLFARGWREVSPGRWVGGHMIDRDRTWSEADAIALMKARDGADLERYGSVTYRPTAEQAQSALLAACAAHGMHEREVIAQLYERVKALEKT